MHKLIGSGCIIAGSLWLLWRNIKNNRRRSVVLMEIMMALRSMADSVRIARVPLPALLEQLAGEYEADTALFFHKIGLAVKQGENAVAAWKKAAAELPIPQEEQAIISKIGEDLRKDEESLCKGIELATYALNKYRDSWEKGRREGERRTSALYLSGAAMLIILLI